MTNFEVIIGIENHVELKTNSKIFSNSPVSYGESPNSQVNEIDLGYPGALPSVNKKGVELAILACNALKMKIDNILRFDRKSYFYSDLPKGFQITQQFHPIGREGYLEIELNGAVKKIGIERIHIEEDTAKQIHKDGKTFIDYNRCGVGLIEIVSKPVLRTSEEAISYVSKLREILLFLNVSDVKMNEGSFRCDINISLRPYGFDGFGNKVEIKNLNSLNNIKKAIDYEIKRQSELILSNQVVEQETRRFDESKQETVLMRKKNDAIDYKYFREPNIFPIKLDNNWIESIIKNSPELADKKRERYTSVYNFKLEETNFILSDYYLTKFFEDCIDLGIEPKKILNYIITDIKALLNKNNITIEKSYISPLDIKDICELMDKGIISSKHAKSIIPIIFESNKKAIEVIEENNWKLISDENEIKSLLLPILQENKSLIMESYSTRRERVEKTIMGVLMKKTGGNINPKISMELITQEIKKIN
ncbi:Asp-tRNA(Asn)/Glu-tRNA(Gln) amidotransferase subunit GatB [Spiroplasma turonicum]|uniref:Aspartyl/glutamyl-tRNA(Asn/Gln) amidotransferase subunit B n=1 Tax=Spiroplasma turonicum TaxID=216946 RepID=A0A0K1P5A9_9MOLU|nr:Asp-tRNA(Asn)/Glu-tRNA(Gln) amidotransferase subunit GatB [Spiroplasma turonicum]AKU79359.1 aspartyl/glutamyl-tRNA amidotransferase subunit B [Spiroplasma turonicum]ALX70380.1 aspartyl/glutamyl-tRNA amidotransferase subunit B [Spiroplasma turonicum]